VSVKKWKTIAWSGVRFAVPDDWDPARIGRRHLLLASELGPVMEIKWAAVKGRFSGRRQLREVARHVGRSGGVFQETAVSEKWRKAAAGFDAQGFQWDSGCERAQGILLYCPTCRTASMIQFLERSGASVIPPPAARVLTSFRDHRRDGRVAWALYDMAACLPDHFVLARYQFEAGRFVLEFNGRGRRLSLYRWAPAEALLQNRNLADFAQAVAGGQSLFFRPAATRGHSAVDGGDGPRGRWQARLGLASFRRLRLWHVAGRNRIFGVRLEGRRPIEDQEMQAVSDGYGMAEERPAGIAAEPP
jgi:hypothetical protein